MEFSYAQFFSKSMPFLDKIGFFLLFIYLFLFFFYFFVNLYPTAPTKCCIPHCCHQMLYPTLLSPNVVYRFVATKCRKLDKKNDFWNSRTCSFSQKVCPFWIKLDFFYYLFIFFYFFLFFCEFFVNLYPTTATIYCVPLRRNQML